ncbi:MAG: SH3 domain-containing protein [Chloroflexi bacterium]|nr:SH3 domain-containing protein [Chloroflexota bacterium]
MLRLTTVTLLCILLVAAGCTLSLPGQQAEAIPQFAGAPQVRITAPLANATYLQGVSVNVQVQVVNAGPDIDRVEVSVDGVLLAMLPEPNPTGASAFGVTQSFTPEDAGTYRIEARAFRAEGAPSDPAAVTINVIDSLPTRTPQATNTLSATLTVQATTAVPSVQPSATPRPPTQAGSVSQTPTSTLPPGPTAAVSATSTVPTARFQGIVNVRRGPSTNFEPPLGTFQAGQSTEILALNTDGTWLKVRFAGGEGWVFRQIVETDGPVDSLPREAGPPIPTLPPATATSPAPVVQPTSAPAQPTASSGDGPNLIVVNWEMRMINGGGINQINTNQPAIAFVRVRNTGNQPAGGFFALITIVNSSDSGNKIVEAGAIGGLAPGEEQIVQVGFTDTYPAGTGRTAVIRLDENNQIPETNEGDNESTPISYTLGP